MPQKSSTSSASTVIRSTSSFTKREENLMTASSSPPPSSPTLIYKSFEDFKQRIVKLSLPALWHVDIQSTVVVISCFSTDHVLPKFEILTDESLKFFIRVYGWMLHDDHEVYLNTRNYTALFKTHQIKPTLIKPESS